MRVSIEGSALDALPLLFGKGEFLHGRDRAAGLLKGVLGEAFSFENGRVDRRKLDIVMRTKCDVRKQCR